MTLNLKRLATVAFVVAVMLTIVASVTALPSGEQPASPAAPAATARLAVAHLAPFAPIPQTAVTVTLNNTTILTNVLYGQSTAYLTVNDGNNSVAIYAGSSLTPAISQTINLVSGTDYSAIAIGDVTNQPLALTLLTDNNTAPASGFAKLRLGHLAPFSNTLPGTAADVRLQDGTPLITNVTFSQVASYLTLAAGTYDLKITAPGGYPTLIDPMPVALPTGAIVSAFATGNGGNANLGVFAWPSNAVGSFLPLGAQLQVAHLAPFANTIAGTSVTVTLNSTPVLTDFVYGESTAYLPVQEGTYTVTVLPGGSTTPAITGTVSLSQAQSYTAIAIGDVINQPLGLSALLDDTTPPPAGFAKLRLGHLAPFSNTLPGTAADVRLWNGTPIITNVLFSQVGTYLTLPAGVYPLQITAPGGSPTLIKPLPVTLVSGANLSAFAVGDVVNQPLGVFALPSGQPGFFLPLLKATIYLPIITRN